MKQHPFPQAFFHSYPEDIEKELTAKWVKEDSFVPIKKIAKVKELDLLALDPDEYNIEVQKKNEWEKKHCKEVSVDDDTER